MDSGISHCFNPYTVPNLATGYLFKLTLVSLLMSPVVVDYLFAFYYNKTFQSHLIHSLSPSISYFPKSPGFFQCLISR